MTAINANFTKMMHSVYTYRWSRKEIIQYYHRLEMFIVEIFL